MRSGLLALLAAVALSAQAAPMPPSETEIEAQRAHGTAWLASGMPVAEVVNKLRLWYGRSFVAEVDRGSGATDIYVVTSEWSNSVLAHVIVHRARVVTVEGPRR